MAAGAIDLDLLERWLSGWSLARGLPLPQRQGGGLTVEVGQPDQLRRHVFADAGDALQACAREIVQPCVYLKAAVDTAVMRAALPPRWQMAAPRTLMRCGGPLPVAAIPAGYTATLSGEFGATVLRLHDGTGAVAAEGKVVIYRGCAVFDQIGTASAHRRRGLGRALIAGLDAVARQAGAGERLLVATDEGRALYLQLGWDVLAPYATAVLPAAVARADMLEGNGMALRWRQDAAPSRP